MEEALLEILAALRDGTRTDGACLGRLLRRHSQGRPRTLSKPELLAFYLDVRERDSVRWQGWGVTGPEEERLLELLRMKPRRTASGVATVSVLTKPWPCSSDCLYCPNDIRMPKSYLASEPACQRAERNCFDPYLQVKARLRVLAEMGHHTDKVELIVLGGTWSDYPEDYQRWFVRELFRALNDDEEYRGGPEEEIRAGCGDVGADGPEGAPAAAWDAAPASGSVAERTAFYATCGLTGEPEALATATADDQAAVDAGRRSYNRAVRSILDGPAWRAAARIQHASWEEVEAAQRANETAAHRVVGLVFETRPDLISPASAHTLRRLGATKVQMGIQSLDDAVLAANGRHITCAQIARAFAVLRAFGFKTHVHAMLNLLGSSPKADKADYQRLVGDPRFCPDEVKLYPCALVASSRLMGAWRDGRWRPYTRDELVDVLVDDVLATPAWTRISRMIRDIPSTDIVVGNRRTNLRQMVEDALADRRDEVREIRMREVATRDVDPAALRLDRVSYPTATSRELFLQWVDEAGHIAGFCRLSLPDEEARAEALDGATPPLPPGTALIRELHVYGRVAALGEESAGSAQHAGLGRALVAEAEAAAREMGYRQLAVISAVGTRPYYRRLGFADVGLYQLREL